MLLKLAIKSLLVHPIRAAALGIGFGLGVGVMATLLGVGEVVLDQARAPALSGGGDLVVSGIGGPVTSARFVLDGIKRTAADDRGSQVIASPRRRADLFLVRPDGKTVPVRARAGIPSLERALGDPETAPIAAWQDTPADAAWAASDQGVILRAMDRFHAVPDIPARATSWAEWLYFKGNSSGVQFYVTFLVGPRQPDGRRPAGIRVQLDRDRGSVSYGDHDLLDDAALLASAPDITIGRSSVRLEGTRYRIALHLPEVEGEITLESVAGRSMAPMVIRGANGWVSGYTVPVMSGRMTGQLSLPGGSLMIDGVGYHDHNWGFWEGVTWRWGQVQHEGRSYLYGRVYPPSDAADPERVPGFLVALGPDGPIGYSTRVTIHETDDPATHHPRRIVVTGQGSQLDLRMELDVRSAILTPRGVLASGADFLQLRADYHVSGRAADQPIDFRAAGAAETFRGR